MSVFNRTRKSSAQSFLGGIRDTGDSAADTVREASPRWIAAGAGALASALGATWLLLRSRKAGEPNDQDLTARVKTELFRPADAPKGSVNVNSVDGTVYLRGQVKSPEQRTEVVRTTQGIDGVRSVADLLHLPGEPAKTVS